MLIEEIKNIKPDIKEQKKAGYAVGIVLLAIGALLMYGNKPAYPYFIGVAAVLLLLAFAAPRALKYFYIAWMTLAAILGFIMTRLILSLLFYIIITPIGIILRLTGKDLLDMKWDKSKNSYWIKKSSGDYKPENTEKQY
ncbi:MAG: SxtJ family membrane protein [Melioribacteraceae bacterium]|nr:SxtJ family membrane protein [Melioribacteraceae bacterium]